jgi:hypothetical protein
MIFSESVVLTREGCPSSPPSPSRGDPQDPTHEDRVSLTKERESIPTPSTLPSTTLHRESPSITRKVLNNPTGYTENVIVSSYSMDNLCE